MTAIFSSTTLAWLLTYAMHSTVLLSLAWLLVRVRRWSPGASELLWKSAILGGIVTASVQLMLEVRPAGSITLQRPAITTPALPIAPTGETETSAPVQATDISSERQLANPSRPQIFFSRSSVAVFAWAFVALILGLSYAARRLILVGRLGDRQAVPDGQLLQMFGELARDAGFRRTPRLTCTSRISSPIALGVSEICVPDIALTDLDAEQQRSLLAHELAHLARRDPIWLGLASLIECVLWIQPLNRVANRQIATSAEFLCDDWAVRRTGSGVPRPLSGAGGRVDSGVAARSPRCGDGRGAFVAPLARRSTHRGRKAGSSIEIRPRNRRGSCDCRNDSFCAGRLREIGPRLTSFGEFGRVCKPSHNCRQQRRQRAHRTTTGRGCGRSSRCSTLPRTTEGFARGAGLDRSVEGFRPGGACVGRRGAGGVRGFPRDCTACRLDQRSLDGRETERARSVVAFRRGHPVRRSESLARRSGCRSSPQGCAPRG